MPWKAANRRDRSSAEGSRQILWGERHVLYEGRGKRCDTTETNGRSAIISTCAMVHNMSHPVCMSARLPSRRGTVFFKMVFWAMYPPRRCYYILCYFPHAIDSSPGPHTCGLVLGATVWGAVEWRERHVGEKAV